MTYCCIVCEVDKTRANRGPGRRNLTPLYPPAAATRDAAAGDSNRRGALVAAESGWVPGSIPGPLPRPAAQTSSVCHGDTVPEPVGRLGGVVTLDTLPGPVGRVSGLTRRYLAAAGEPRLRGLP